MFSLNKRHRFEWVGRHGGGPLIAVPSSRLESWSGRHGDDLDRARSSDHYLSFVEVDGESALVLGDEPFDTTWLPTPASGGGMFVRRLWSNSARDAIEAAHGISVVDWSFEEGALDVTSGKLVLFDAARAGDALRSSVTIDLAPGRYAIATADAAPDEDTCIMAHRLLPID